MNALSRVLGLVGGLVAAWGVYGRFHGPPTLAACGHEFAAASALLFANTLFLAAIFIRLISVRK